MNQKSGFELWLDIDKDHPIFALRQRGEFFRKGQIIPRRILKCHRRHFQHLARFGSDCWALRTGRGNYVIVQAQDARSAIHIPYGVKGSPHIRLNFQGSPYGKEGTFWEGPNIGPDAQFANAISALNGTRAK